MAMAERPLIEYQYEQVSEEVADNPVIPAYFLWGSV